MHRMRSSSAAATACQGACVIRILKPRTATVYTRAALTLSFGSPQVQLRKRLSKQRLDKPRAHAPGQKLQAFLL
jgi:hypothetical protein